MSTKAIAWAWDQKTGSPAAKVVLVALAEHVAMDSWQGFPSVKRLADYCEISQRTVQRHLQDLEDLGLIERSPRFRENGSRTSDLYTLAGGTSPLHDATEGGDNLSGGPVTPVSPP